MASLRRAIMESMREAKQEPSEAGSSTAGSGANSRAGSEGRLTPPAPPGREGSEPILLL